MQITPLCEVACAVLTIYFALVFLRPILLGTTGSVRTARNERPVQPRISTEEVSLGNVISFPDYSECRYRVANPRQVDANVMSFRRRTCRQGL